MLVEHASEPAVQKRLAEAVKHENPAVRAVAARAAFVTMSKGLAPALIAAVAKEEHAQTAAEQVRALMGLLGAPGDQIVLRAVTRIGGPAAIAMAESLARTRPGETSPGLLPTLCRWRIPGELGAALATACAQHPASANEILQATLASKSPYLFEAAVSLPARSGAPDSAGGADAGAEVRAGGSADRGHLAPVLRRHHRRRGSRGCRGRGGVETDRGRNRGGAISRGKTTAASCSRAFAAAVRPRPTGPG